MYSSIIAVCWIAFILVWLVMGGLAKKSIRAKGQHHTSTIYMVIAMTSVVLVLHTKGLKFLITYHLFPSTPLIQSIGVFSCAAGIAFAIWARIHLGKNWGMPMSLKEKPDLVTSGPYHFVRHPIYTGLLAAMLGTNINGGFMGLVWLLFPLLFLFIAQKGKKK